MTRLETYVALVMVLLSGGLAVAGTIFTAPIGALSGQELACNIANIGRKDVTFELSLVDDGGTVVATPPFPT